jgi:hypothetical protein
MNKQSNTQVAKTAKPLTEEELNAQIALTGNLAGLTPAEQMAYYERYCRHLGLDPITRPFDLLTTFDENGVPKTVLYANASCSAQLADKREVCYSKPEKEYDQLLGVLTIRVEAFIKIGDNRFRGTHRSGVAHIDGLKGKRLENAIKKAETQAHRRATLALCGVAMPDESEIEDIAGALATPIVVKALPADRVSPDQIPSAAEVFGNRPAPVTAPLPAAWQDDSIACQIADQTIAETITKELNTPSITATKQKGKPAPDPDPVSALTPTLTAAQQRVSDAVMSLWKEHKKDKRESLTMVCDAIKRQVNRSADLTDEEADKAFKYLQAWGVELSAEASEKAEPIKYTSTVRAHDLVVGGEMDALIKKLTILGMSGADLSKLISDFMSGAPFYRVIENRFELDGEEAKTVIAELRARIVDMEAEKAAIIAADV